MPPGWWNISCGILLLILAGICSVSSKDNEAEGDFHKIYKRQYPGSQWKLNSSRISSPSPTTFTTTSTTPLPSLPDQKVDDKITDILHSLLQKYDNRIRPLFMKQPLLIQVGLTGVEVDHVLEDGEAEIVMTLTLQQKWTDPRLIFESDEDHDDASRSNGISYIVINSDHTREFWLPDTYVTNEKTNEVLNDALVLYPDGEVVRSVRGTVNVNCRFYYDSFPFDTQLCQIHIGSSSNIFGSYMQELLYLWEENFMVSMSVTEKNKLISSRTGQFVITSVDLFKSKSPSSSLTFQLTLQRFWRPFITRFYLPMILFVFVSIGCLFFNDPKTSLVVNLINLALMNIFAALHNSSSGSEVPKTNFENTALDAYFVMSVMFSLLSTTISTVQLHKLKFRARHTNTSRLNGARTVSDIFSPDERLQSQNDDDDDQRRIYRSPSYQLQVTSRSKFICKKILKILMWVLGYGRWLVLGMFLISDYIYFKIYAE